VLLAAVLRSNLGRVARKRISGAFLFQCAGVKRDEIPTAEGLPPSSF